MIIALCYNILSTRYLKKRNPPRAASLATVALGGSQDMERIMTPDFRYVNTLTLSCMSAGGVNVTKGIW